MPMKKAPEGMTHFSSIGQEKVDIGIQTTIGPFSTIGFAGFGFEKNKEGTDFRYPLKRKAHDFKVKIGNNVSIGQGCNVDRGSWRDTIIDNGTVIDSLVHIAHNTQIGRHCVIAAGTIIGGSCDIGNKVFIGLNVTIKDHIKIGNNATIGSGANIIENVPNGATVVSDNKARILE